MRCILVSVSQHPTNGLLPIFRDEDDITNAILAAKRNDISGAMDFLTKSQQGIDDVVSVSHIYHLTS